MKTTHKSQCSLLKIGKVSFTIIGTIIGAGFASGKEVATFLGVYGNFTYIASLIFCGLFCVGTIYFSNMDKSLISPALNTAINISIFTSEFISIIAMMAGLNAIFDMLFTSQIPYHISLVLIFLIIITGFNGLTSTNLILVPILIISIIIFGVIGATTSPNYKLITTNCSPIFTITSLPLYIGMNLFSIFPIAIEFSSYQTKKERTISAIISSVLLYLLVLSFCFTILNANYDVCMSELPLIIFIIDVAPTFILLTIITLAIAIITTIISDGFVVHTLLKKKIKKGTNILLLFIFIVAYFISKLGFSNIVEKFYPITGFIGAVLTLILVIKGITTKFNQPKTFLKKRLLKSPFN